MTGSASSVNGEANLTFNGSTLAITGSQTVSSNITVSGYYYLGALAYGRLSHNGSQLLIENPATVNSHIYLQDTSGNLYAKAHRSTSTGWWEEFYYDGVSSEWRTKTTSFGFEVNGIIATDDDVEAFSTTSDARLKKDFIPIINGLDIIKTLRPIEYTSLIKKHYGERHPGLIAQEVAKIIPMAVWERHDGFLALRDERITPFLISAVQTIDSEIECLKREINDLKTKIKELEEK